MFCPCLRRISNAFALLDRDKPIRLMSLECDNDPIYGEQANETCFSHRR